MHDKAIRWRQRFQNLQQAFAQLQKGLSLPSPSDMEQQGIIQSVEFTCELAWKTLKDYLESQQVAAQFHRDVIKQAFHYQLITDGDTWMDMLDRRNQMAHTYDESAASEALQLIRDRYHPALAQVVRLLATKTGS